MILCHQSCYIFPTSYQILIRKSQKPTNKVLIFQSKKQMRIHHNQSQIAQSSKFEGTIEIEIKKGVIFLNRRRREDSLVLGPAGWFHRAWSLDVAIWYYSIYLPSLLSTPRFSFSFSSVSSSYQRALPTANIRCRLDTKSAREGLLVISASPLFSSVDFWDMFKSRRQDFSEITMAKRIYNINCIQIHRRRSNFVLL